MTQATKTARELPMADEEQQSKIGASSHPITFAEALSRDFRDQPLSPEERRIVVDYLYAALLALGCPHEKLPKLYDDVLALIGEASQDLLFPKALEEAMKLRRERETKNILNNRLDPAPGRSL